MARLVVASLLSVVACLSLPVRSSRTVLQVTSSKSAAQTISNLLLSLNGTSAQGAPAPVGALLPDLVHSGGVQTESVGAATTSSGTASLQSLTPSTSVCQELQDPCNKDVQFSLSGNELDLYSADTTNCGSDGFYLIASGEDTRPHQACQMLSLPRLELSTPVLCLPFRSIGILQPRQCHAQSPPQQWQPGIYGFKRGC